MTRRNPVAVLAEHQRHLKRLNRRYSEREYTRLIGVGWTLWQAWKANPWAWTAGRMRRALERAAELDQEVNEGRFVSRILSEPGLNVQLAAVPAGPSVGEARP